MLQENQITETKQRNGAKTQTETQIEKPKPKPKKYDRSSIQDKYPLNPDYLNQIVVLGKDISAKLGTAWCLCHAIGYTSFTLKQKTISTLIRRQLQMMGASQKTQTMRHLIALHYFSTI